MLDDFLPSTTSRRCTAAPPTPGPPSWSPPAGFDPTSFRRLPVRASILDAFRRGGFVVHEDTRDELVLGAVGRFWRASGGMARIDPERFREFSEPGWAKGAFNFRVEEVEGRTVLTTETRVCCTDESARRSFRRYWGADPLGHAARSAWRGCG
jgi:hypothetical protein